MSVTSSRAADVREGAPPEPGMLIRVRPARLLRLRSFGVLSDAALAVFAVAAVVLMARHPEWATVPYHLLFLSVMLVYGFRIWPLPVTALVIVAITSVTGALMVEDFIDGGIETPELAEIPLMPALLVAMVWHARRRADAMRALLRMTTQQTEMLERERTFFRDTSHAIRTPVTIARGHLELADANVSDPGAHEDIDVAVRQLDRMSVLSHRLLTLAQLDAGDAPPAECLDLADFVHEIADNWSVRSQRRWGVDCPTTALIRADRDWLALAIDALVENAVHFTAEDGTIQISGIVRPDTCAIVVTDDGVGIADDDVDRVFDRFWHRRPPSGPMGSGLGLAMTSATARAWGGGVSVQSRAGQGARFEFWLPRFSDGR
jgi:signal transduction histidine kinase